MNKYSLAAEAIKERVSMPDAIALYAPTPPPRHDRIPCPVHHGESYNLSFTDKLYHCFVCGSGGDVISFTQHVFGLDFPAALDKLNTDFNCGAILDRKPTLREQRDAQERYKALVAKREQEAAERQAREEFYWSLWDEYIRLDLQRMRYFPADPSEDFDPLYVEAVKQIDYIEYLIDELL